MKLRVGTFNLYQFVEPPYAYYTRKNKYNKRQWLEKTTWIKQQIIKMDCDIIGFQEVFSQEALKTLVNELGFTYFETVDKPKLSTTTPNKYMTTTVAIASKYPVQSLSEIQVHSPSLQYHGFVEEFVFSRVPIKASIALPNTQEIIVYVCHLKSNRLNAYEKVFGKKDTIEEKKAHTLEVLQNKNSAALKQRLCEASSLFFDIEQSKELPTILLGDLNDKVYSPTTEALCNTQYHDHNKEGLVLYDAYDEYETYNTQRVEKINRIPTTYIRSSGHVLDYIFVSKYFQGSVTDYQVLDEHLKRYKIGSIIQSDHAQVVCEIDFNER